MPRSVLRNIALQLNLQDFVNLLQCSKGIYSAIHTSEVWYQRFQTRFGQRILGILDIPRPALMEGHELDPKMQLMDEVLGDHQWILVGSDEVSSSIDSNGQRRLHTQSLGQKYRDTADESDDASEDAHVKAQLVKSYQRFSRTVIPASEMCIAHSDKVRYWVFAQTDVSRFGTVAVLRSIWWMDITAVFYGVDLSPEARYKVQWRLRTDNESAIVGSEFRAVIFGKDEDPFSPEVLRDRAASVSFKPKTFSAYAQHTDLNQSCSCASTPKPRLPTLSSFPPPSEPLFSRSKKAFYLPSYWTKPADTFTHLNVKDDQGLTTDPAHPKFSILTLPESIAMDRPDLPFARTTGGIVVQIRNYNNWKSGLRIDYAQLIRE
ncbi:hypothetical protein BGZ68_001499 [Mortierella alpina]|nr:hypothetical protein BGZ68_001499 [Mortierella alpina]